MCFREVAEVNEKLGRYIPTFVTIRSYLANSRSRRGRRYVMPPIDGHARIDAQIGRVGLAIDVER